MRWRIVLCLTVVPIVSAWAQKHHDPVPFPQEFQIGRHTFFDFGPPFDFYEILTVRPTSEGTSVVRVLLTPQGAACVAPARIEVAAASRPESVVDLLGNTNPCAIPEKELRHELKRCKKCGVFSGVNITMRVPCGTNTRLVRSDILDKDLFSSAPNTPEHTSWTMQLLARLDQGLGPGVMDKPAFPFQVPDTPTAIDLDPAIQQELATGSYDELFPSANPRASDLFREAQVKHSPPTIRLVSSVPSEPLQPVLPEYPPLARMARAQGSVTFKVNVNAGGLPDVPVLETGNPLLFEAVKRAVAKWEFPEQTAGQEIRATIEFDLHCPAASK